MTTAFECVRTIRLGHTDAARRLYFARQFDLVHETYEDWLAHEGLSIRTLVEDPHTGLPIVHAESDYRGQLFAADEVTIALEVLGCSERSFTLGYTLTCRGRTVGTAKTVHVAVGPDGKSCALPDAVRALLERNLRLEAPCRR